MPRYVQTTKLKKDCPIRNTLTLDSLVGNNFSNHGLPINCAMKSGSGGGGGGGVGKRGGGGGVGGGLKNERQIPGISVVASHLKL